MTPAEQRAILATAMKAAEVHAAFLCRGTIPAHCLPDFRRTDRESPWRRPLLVRGGHDGNDPKASGTLASSGETQGNGAPCKVIRHEV
jgi:hypothetical protein